MADDVNPTLPEPTPQPNVVVDFSVVTEQLKQMQEQQKQFYSSYFEQLKELKKGNEKEDEYGY